MVSVKKSTLMKYAAVAASLLAIGSIVGVIVMGISNMEYQMKTDLKTSTMNGPTTDQSLPDVATAYNPPLRTSDPDLKLAVETISLTESNIYDSSVKKPDINTRKLEGKIFSLNGFFKNDGDDDSGSIHFSHETIPALDEEMVHLLSAIVSRGSHPEIKANVKTKKSLELEEKMMKLMTSIISRETNTMDRGKMVETLTSIVLEHGIDPDIKGKMTDVLSHIVNKIHKTNPEVELEMVKLISEVITQDTDEVLKLKILNTLLTIASQEIHPETKSRLVTILSAIAREGENLETQLKTATLLSNIVHQYGRDETRANIQRILSLIVPSMEKLESTIEYTEESQLDNKSEIVDVFSKVTQAEKTTEVDFDERVENINLLSNITQKEKATKATSRLVELVSSVPSSQYLPMRAAINQILSKVISAKNNFRKTDQNALEADVEENSGVLNVRLSNVM